MPGPTQKHLIFTIKFFEGQVIPYECAITTEEAGDTSRAGGGGGSNGHLSSGAVTDEEVDTWQWPT